MSGQILIEAHDIARSLGLPTGAEHLYLVYREDGNGAEYVLRSGPTGVQFFGGRMDIGINVPIARSEDDRDGDTPQDRSSTPLDFAGLTDDAAWSIMVKYARGLDAADTVYNAFTTNSNAFVGALLHAAGGDPIEMLPEGVSASEAIGVTSWDAIVRDVAPPGDGVFRGTAAADARFGLQMDEVFALFAGDDSLSAGRGDDLARGGSGLDRLDGQNGNDRLYGQSGADALRGGAGNDRLIGGIGADRLSGGPGADLLVGGDGGDRLVGGSGADVFDFAAGGGRDEVMDFQAGSDRLLIHPATALGFADLALSRTGPGDADLRVGFDGAAVILHDVPPGAFDAEDVIILPPDALMA